MWRFAEKPSAKDFRSLADRLPDAEQHELHPALWPRRKMVAKN